MAAYVRIAWIVDRRHERLPSKHRVVPRLIDRRDDPSSVEGAVERAEDELRHEAVVRRIEPGLELREPDLLAHAQIRLQLLCVGH